MTLWEGSPVLTANWIKGKSGAPTSWSELWHHSLSWEIPTLHIHLLFGIWGWGWGTKVKAKPWGHRVLDSSQPPETVNKQDGATMTQKPSVGHRGERRAPEEVGGWMSCSHLHSPVLQASTDSDASILSGVPRTLSGSTRPTHPTLELAQVGSAACTEKSSSRISSRQL